jgi:hypothetical protein
MNQRDIFLISLLISAVAFHEMLTRGILTMDMLQNILSGNVITYTFLAGVLSFFRTSGKYQPEKSNNNELEKMILTLNNELQKMRAENEWRNDAISQGKSNSHDLTHMIYYT